MINQLKKKIPFKFKMNMLVFLHQFRSLKGFNKFGLKIPKRSTKRIFIFLAADYGNLGDVAITYAQHKFLKQQFPGYLVTEIPISVILKGVAFVKKIANKTDIITIVGGGNMGDLYPMIEHFRQLVISNFPENTIISFPQTIDFNDSKKGNKALKHAIKVYGKHQNLTLIAREQKSYDYFKKHFTKNKLILTPDIVLSLNKTQPIFKREGVILCMRDDKEKKLTSSQKEKLIDSLTKQFNSIKKRDTHIGGEGISLKTRVSQLNNIWEDFKKAELVVTDRLHGMIFCYITGTPVIVFQNNNHKVRSSYYWINSAQHVKLIEEFSTENIQMAMEELKNVDKDVHLENMSHFYDNILKTIDS